MTNEDLPFEQARNTHYLERLKAKLESPIDYGISRSQLWVDPKPINGRTYDVMHPLIGRVGLVTEDELVGRSFYIGARHIEDGDLRVFSWAAPVARLFFDVDGGGYDDVDPSQVAVRRTFDHHIDDISDLYDEWLRPVDPSPLAGAELVVKAPVGASRRRRGETPPTDVRPEPRPEESAAPDNPPVTLVPAPLVEGMRSPEVVLRKLSAPRKHQLPSVLTTLQPDQYDLVSHPANQSLLVQGHPGTGKTVVAAYRAAYLVHPEGGGNIARKVMLIGPTADYVTHVESLIRPLDPAGRILVTHLAALLSQTVGVESTWGGGIGGEHDDVDATARGLADLAVRRLQQARALKSGRNVRRENIRAIYEMVASNGEKGQPLSTNADQAIWMSKLPTFEKAFRLRRYLALMAQCALAIQQPPPTDRFDHIIVDEAQDVSPIEWNVLDQYLAATGNWTLVGDMNQRRSDATYATWNDIGEHLALGDGDTTLPLKVMHRGYRSTQPILRFADKLLPAAQRGSQSIQSAGPPVRVEYARTQTALMPTAIDVARELIDAHRSGTVVLITVDPGNVIQELGKKGWRRGSDHSTWIRAERTLRVLVPEAARGLEFDAVVVVEPDAFPENLGRAGQLYTSLTRANRELAVVWHRGLPDPLRRAARS